MSQMRPYRNSRHYLKRFGSWLWRMPSFTPVPSRMQTRLLSWWARGDGASHRSTPVSIIRSAGLAQWNDADCKQMDRMYEHVRAFIYIIYIYAIYRHEMTGVRDHIFDIAHEGRPHCAINSGRRMSWSVSSLIYNYLLPYWRRLCVSTLLIDELKWNHSTASSIWKPFNVTPKLIFILVPISDLSGRRYASHYWLHETAAMIYFCQSGPALHMRPAASFYNLIGTSLKREGRCNNMKYRRPVGPGSHFEEHRFTYALSMHHQPRCANI